MENKTKYESIGLFGVSWVHMREEEGFLAGRCWRHMTSLTYLFN